jgi:hypothetical protein
MGQYRHVTDLAAFARGLTITAPLRFIPASDFARRRGAASRLLNELPELPEPSKEALGAAILPLSAPVLRWEVIRMAVAAAESKGYVGTEIDGHHGRYLRLEVGNLGLCEFDDAFQAALASGAAIREGEVLFVRVHQGLLN